MTTDHSTRMRKYPRWRLRVLIGLAIGLYVFGQAYIYHVDHDLVHPSSSPKWNQASQRIIAEVRALGGNVQVQSAPRGFVGLGGSRELFSISFHGQKISNETLARLRKVCDDRIVYLGLGNTKLTDDGLRHLEGLSHLERLVIGNLWSNPKEMWPVNAITDAGLVHLKGLNGLTSLSLSGLPVTDAGLDSLKDLPNLCDIYLDQTQVKGTSLGRLKSLPRLGVLNLKRSAVTDEGLSSLSGLSLPNLTALYLDQTAVTDKGLSYLSGASNLRILSLNRVSLTGEGLEPLRTLPRLETLEITECGLLDEEVADFRKAKPGVKVDRH